jgi:NitT/TauT family transport system permease protein
MRRLLPSAARLLDAAVVVLILALFVAGWETYVRLGDVKEFVLPAPSVVAETMVDERGSLLRGAAETTKAFVLGFLLAATVGVALATLVVSLPRIGRGVYPLVVASQTVPVIAVAPLIVIWLGFGLWPKVVTAALISFFPVVVSTVVGYRTVSESAIDLMRSIPAGRATTFRKLLVPAALPSMFAGFRTASVLAVIGAVVGEFVAGGTGLAAAIVLAKSSLQTEVVIANIVALAVLGSLFYAAIASLERLATPWRFSTVRPRRRLMPAW